MASRDSPRRLPGRSKHPEAPPEVPPEPSRGAYRKALAEAPSTGSGCLRSLSESKCDCPSCFIRWCLLSAFPGCRHREMCLVCSWLAELLVLHNPLRSWAHFVAVGCATQGKGAGQANEEADDDMLPIIRFFRTNHGFLINGRTAVPGFTASSSDSPDRRCSLRS